LSDHSTLTDQGGREANEDALLVAIHGATKCWVVCDGLGGHFGGEVASKAAVVAIERAFAEQPEVAESTISRCLLRAEEAILAAQKTDPALVLMRTTAVVLVADRERAVWGHLGDSRLYHFRDGRIASQTRDHSVPGVLAVTGQIESAEIRHHVDRGRLLRSLGEGVELKAVIAPVVPLSPTDGFLLCTDGFWEYVLEEEMEADFVGHRTADAWLSAMRERLVARVAGAGDNDNFTAVAVCFQGEATLGSPPSAAPAMAPRAASPEAKGQASPGNRLAAITAVATVVVLATGAFWMRGPIGARVKSRLSSPNPAADLSPTLVGPSDAAATGNPALALRDPAVASPPEVSDPAPPPPVAAVTRSAPVTTPAPPPTAQLPPVSSELVPETYDRTFVAGMEAFTEDNWRKAISLLEAARRIHPAESTDKQFQVKNETNKRPYLPSFYISVAQMNLRRCPAARSTWQAAPSRPKFWLDRWDDYFEKLCS